MVEKFKKALIKTLLDRCTIKTTKLIIDENGVVTGETDSILYEDIPCGISQYNMPSSNQGIGTNASNGVKIFFDNNVKIPLNSVIIVQHYNEERIYTLSGTPIVYDTHIEVSVMEKV